WPAVRRAAGPGAAPRPETRRRPRLRPRRPHGRPARPLAGRDGARRGQLGRDAGRGPAARPARAPGVPPRRPARLGPARPVDVLVSNATLQWVPGHLDLLGRLAGLLARPGTLAFQVPGNFDAPSHRLLVEMRTAPRWRDRLGRDAD